MSAERIKRLTAMREGGMTMQAIADIEGVSRQRVHQLLNRRTNPPRTPGKKRSFNWEAARELRRTGSSVKDIADMAGVTPAGVYNALRRLKDG